MQFRIERLWHKRGQEEFGYMDVDPFELAATVIPAMWVARLGQFSRFLGWLTHKI